jgi:hypothetical protein
MMEPPGWSRVKTVVQEALARRPEDRHAYLDQACDGDRALREEVDSLLRADAAATAAHFAGQPAIAALTAEVVLPSLDPLRSTSSLFLVPAPRRKCRPLEDRRRDGGRMVGKFSISRLTTG